MTQASGIIRPEEAPQETPEQGNMALFMAKMLLKNPSIPIKLRGMGADKKRCIAPPRSYKLPEYRKGMKYLTSKELHVRATRWRNPRELLVVALAHELGAYELSDREFAEAAYWWLKTNVWYAVTGFDGPSGPSREGRECVSILLTPTLLCAGRGIKARCKGYLSRDVLRSVTRLDKSLCVHSIRPWGIVEDFKLACAGDGGAHEREDGQGSEVGVAGD
jgi:hypothetical protein